MDKCTYEVRRQHWAGIIAQCHARPEGQSAKQWMKDNGIREATYYLWQRRIRNDVYGQLQSDDPDTEKIPAGESSGEIIFAELPCLAETQPAENTVPNTFPPVMIKVGKACIELPQDMPESLLAAVIRAAANA